MTEFGVWFCMTISRNQPDVFDQSTSNIEKSERSLSGEGLFWAATWATSSKGNGRCQKSVDTLAKRSREILRSNKKMVLRQWNVEQKRTESSWKNLLERNTNVSMLSRRHESERRILMAISLDELSFVKSNYEKILQLHPTPR